jgi:acid phosphatase (class A)
MADSRITPLTKKKTSGSYPSGHTTIGTVMGILLANIIPEKRTELMTRAWEYGNNRIIAGQHIASDIEAGRLAGTAIAAVLQTHPEFMKDFEAAKAELRSVLDLK